MVKKLTKILSLIFLSLAIYSCDTGCVSEDEFSGYSVEVNSKSESTGIIGTYNPVDGGQIANWQNTNLRSNGEEFIIQIKGAWTPWYGSQMNEASLNNLSKCSFCAKKEGVENCLCYEGQTPQAELSSDGYNYVRTDCSVSSNQDDPAKCTCTQNYGSATDYTAYHIPLNYMDKYENIKTADNQSTCKYYGGMGLYIGLFGRSGNENPERIYHLFSQNEVCDVVRNSNGECLDDNDRDVTKYIFRSAHSTIFVKDDNNGNNTDDDSNATYHSPHEQVKLNINDGYYADNYGKYNVSFYNGVGSTNTKGILEYLVSLVEDNLLGEIGEDGKREGGIIRFMYQSIVQDSGFILILQILLTMYISFYGLATLIGVAEITKKDLLERLLKFALIIFFTSSDSWNWYNDIVVSFFKDGMDAVIGMIMNLSDQNFDSKTSSIIIAQMDRASDASNATRFSYVDLTIEKLFSFAAAKKIFGLFFGTFFGFFYIFIIYALIFYLLYVTLNAALVYAINLMKLMFLLALGPIFICFTLFAQTNGIFKKWLLFLSARSLEMVMMFLILYNFIVLINNQFVSMLYYKSCVESYNLYLFSLKILKAETNRALMSWVSYFFTIGGLIFMLQLIFDKVAQVAGYLISLGGDLNRDTTNVDDNTNARGQSSFNAAGKIMGNAFNFTQSIVGSGLYNGAGVLAQGADMVGSRVARVANAAGGKIMKTEIAQAVAGSFVGKAIGKVYENIPNDPRTFYRNRLIDAEIEKAKKENPSLSGAALDLKIRDAVVKAMQVKMYRGENPKGKNIHDPSGMNLAGIDTAAVLRRLDEKLVQEPLKNFLKETAAKLKSSENAPIGNAMQDAIKESARNWANQNLSGGEAAIEKHLKKMNSFIKKQAKFSTSDAAKTFGDSVEGQNRYLQHLKENEFIQKQKSDQSKKGIFFGATHSISRGITRLYSRDEKQNPIVAREVFIRKLNKQQAKAEASQKYAQKLDVAKDYGPLAKAAKHAKEYFNPFNLDGGNIRDRATGDFVLPNYISKQSQQVRNASTSSVRNGLKILSEEQAAIEKVYADKVKSDSKGFVSGFTKREAEQEKEKSLKNIAEKKVFFVNQLKKDALLKDDFASKLQELQKLNKGKDIASIESATKLRQEMLYDALAAVEKSKKDIKDLQGKINSFSDEEKRKSDDLKKYSEDFKEFQKEKEEFLEKLTDENKKKEIVDQISKDQKKYEEVVENEKKVIAKLAAQKEEFVKSIGGEELLKEGLATINGTTFVEEQSRLRHLEELAKKANDDSVEEIKSLNEKAAKRQYNLESLEDEELRLSSEVKSNQERVDQLKKREINLSEASEIEVNQKLRKSAEESLVKSQKDLAKLQSKAEQAKKKLVGTKIKKFQKELEEEVKEGVTLESEDIFVERKNAAESLDMQERYKAKKLGADNVVDELSKVSEEMSSLGKPEEIDDKISILDQAASVAEKMAQKIDEEIDQTNKKYQESFAKLMEMNSAEEIEKRRQMEEVYNIRKNNVNPFQAEEDLEEFVKQNKGAELYAAMSDEDLSKARSDFDAKIKQQQDDLSSITKQVQKLIDAKFEQQKIISSTNVQGSVAKNVKESLKLKEQYQKDLAELKELQEQMQSLQKVSELGTLEEKRSLINQKQKLSNSIIAAEQKLYESQKIMEVDREKLAIDAKKEDLNSKLLNLSSISEEYRDISIAKQEEILALQKARQEKYEQFAKLKEDKDNLTNDVKIKELEREVFNLDAKSTQMIIDQAISQKVAVISIEEITFESERLKLLELQEKVLGREMTLEEKRQESQIMHNIQNYETIIEASKIELAQYRANVANGIIQEVSSIIDNGYAQNDQTKELVKDKSEHLGKMIESLEQEAKIKEDITKKYSKNGGENSVENDVAGKSKDAYSIKSSLFADKMQITAKAKLTQLNIILKKSELDNLKAIKPENLTPADLQKISDLEQEVSGLESKFKKHEEDYSEVDGKIAAVDN